MSKEQLIFKFKSIDPELVVFDAKDYDIPELMLENVEKKISKPIYSHVLEINNDNFDDFYDVYLKIDRDEKEGFLFIFKKQILFSFEYEVGVESGSILLNHCVFQNTLVIEAQRYISAYFFHYCFFNNGLTINGGLLEKGLTFSKSQFSSLSITSSSICDFFSFRNCEFIGVVKLKNNSIESNLKIMSCTFRDLFTLQHSNSDKQYSVEIGFGIFKSFLDINNTSFEKLEPVFFNTKFEIKTEVIQKGYNGFRIRKSANKLKKHFRSIADLIEANTFANIELEAYRLDPLKSISWWDKQILFWNYWSNKHGTSPGYALSFIGLTTLVFSILLCIPIAGQLHWDIVNGFGPTVNLFFKVLMITNWKFAPYGTHSFWTLPILFVGRVFIGYGIYQFIAAFRKYAKN
jgi:hypothetical protein